MRHHAGGIAGAARDVCDRGVSESPARNGLASDQCDLVAALGVID
jgi:hypothetical protein